MDRRTLGTALGALMMTGLVAWTAGGAVLAPPGKRDVPWVPGVPAASVGACRIVSTNVGVDEILLSLVPPGRLAAVSALADDPTISNVVAEARAVPGRLRAVDAERILAFRPDLVVFPPYTRREVVLQIEEAGVPVLRMPDCRSLEDVRVHLRTLGAAVGASDRAEALVRGMDRVLEEVRARTAGVTRPRVLYTSLNGYTQGAGTMFDLFLEAAGGRNVAAEAGVEGWGTLPVEVALALDPDVLLVPGYGGGRKAREVGMARNLACDPAWRTASAVRAGRVHTIPGSHILATSQHVTRTAEDIARVLHPERFGE